MNNQQNTIDLLIKTCEGIRLTAYPDEGGIWTIGIGLARTYLDGTPIKKGDTCTEKEAYTWLNEYLEKNVYPAVNALCNGHNVPPEIFESLCCFAYNEGNTPFLHPQFEKSIQDNNWNDLANIMLLYNKVRKKGELVFSPGLNKRRLIEINHFRSFLC
jgi:lysozyme